MSGCIPNLPQITSSSEEVTKPGVPSFTIVGIGGPILHLPASPIDIGDADEFDAELPTQEFHRLPPPDHDDAVVVDVDPILRPSLRDRSGVVGLRVITCRGMK